MVEGAGANKVSGVLVMEAFLGTARFNENASRSPGAIFCTECAFENASRTRSKRLPLRNFELHKKRGRPKKVDLFLYRISARLLC